MLTLAPAAEEAAVGELPFHPLADLFPLIEAADFAALVASIREHGQLEEIVTLDGMVLDGRNRYRACRAAGVEPRSVDFAFAHPGLDPVHFVLAKNLPRRHLSESQRATVGAELCGFNHGGDRRSDQAADRPLVSQAEAAKLVHVSERLVRRAVAVRDNGAPELWQAVRAGRVALDLAVSTVRLAREQQLSVIESAAAGELNAARSVVKRETRARREAELAERQLELPDKRYGVILADPEWRYRPWSARGYDRAPDNHYPTSTTEAIMARPVASIAAADCALFLWATAPMLADALAVLRGWGFELKSGFVWHKLYPGERTGLGYWARIEHEHLLLATRGDVPCPAPGTQWRSLVAAPVGEHSAKPDVFYQMIEDYFPSLAKIELNARRRREGWDAWGLDAPEEGCRGGQ